jgi:branched-subunit amino acid ABC-type transport system permease component
MELFAQQVLNGLVTGSVYSLVALGLTLIYGTMQVPNFAHGQLYMLGAYVSYSLVTVAGVPYWGALGVSVVALALVGAALERLVFRPLRHAPPLNSMIAALGVMRLPRGRCAEHLGRGVPTHGLAGMAWSPCSGLPVTAHRVVLLVVPQA